MRRSCCQNLLQVGWLVALGAAIAGCGAPEGEGEDETVGSETAALTGLPVPNLRGCSGRHYSERLGMYLTPVRDNCLSWSNMDDVCPSGACQYTVYRRVNGKVTVVADRYRDAPPPADVHLWTPVWIKGWSRFEYWVVAADVADPNVTSPASNTIVMTRSDYLHPDEYLFADNPIYAFGGTYRLYPQADGNLVYSKYDTARAGYTTVIWSTGRKTGANRLYMQADGNLVYSAQPADVAKWTTRTESTPTRDNRGAELVLTTNNRLDVRLDDEILWRSDTGRTY